MKKLRSRIIIMLIIINLVSSLLSDLLTTPLEPALFGDQESWVVDLTKTALRITFTLVIFTLFVILGVREITAPVLRLAKAANQIAGGDFDVEIPETRRRDEIGQLERSFDVMAKGLRSTEYMQKDFISNVSHEYRTPLAVIAGYARLLEDETLSAQNRTQYCRFIVDEAERLSSMTGNILLLSRLESQGIQPAFAPFSVDEQLRQAALLYLPRAQEKGLDLDIDVPDLVISGNAELMMHAWTNLLENAIKFSARGGDVKVRARSDASTVTVLIADRGIGMPEDTKARIFDQFFQGDTSHREAGNGLGLALAQRIVQLHRGDIQVDTAPGEGSTFVVTLPKAL